MNITPVIPDGYNGTVKQLTCRICKHLFYLALADYERLREVSYCHECSLVLLEELERNQAAPGSTAPGEALRPASLQVTQAPICVHRTPEPVSASPRQTLHVPQPRSIDRDKMTVAQLLEEAKLLDKTWHRKEALLSYEQALQRDAGCMEAIFGKGEMLRQLDRAGEALAVYDDILRLDPTSARAWGEKGWTLVSFRRYTEAQAAFDHALQLDPSADSVQSGKRFLTSHIFHLQRVEKDAETVKRQAEAKETLARPCRSAQDYYEAGYALITLDRNAEAFAAFSHSIELDPFNLDVYEYVSTLHFTRGDHEQSLALYDQALQIFVDCAVLHEKRAEVLVRLKRYAEALDACQRALQLDDTRASVYSEKGEILHRLRRFREALDVFDLAIGLDPDDITPRKRKAETFADWGKHEDALAVYEQVIQLDPYDFYSYWEKARLLARIGRDEDALAVYDQYIDQNPQSFHGYEWKLLFILERKRYADGLATCERCIAQQLHLAQAYEWKGLMLHDLDRDEEALASYEEAHRLNPRDEGILLAQVGILVQAKRLDEALERCEQAIRLAPTKPGAYEEKGDILRRLKRYEDALPAYRKVGQLDPKNTSVHEKVGDTLSALERFDEAVKAYDHVLRLKPDDAGAYCSKVRALEKSKYYDQALAVCNKGLQHRPENLSLLSARAGVLKKLMRYEEANAEYDRLRRLDSRSYYVLSSMLGKVDLEEIAAAKARLEAAGKEISDESTKAEIRLMHEEKRAAELKAALRASPLFGPICLLMQESQEWSGTPKQFKELICSHFPDEFATWYRAPHKYVDELKKIAPELRVEGITVGVPPETALVTLTKTVSEEQPHPA